MGEFEFVECSRDGIKQIIKGRIEYPSGCRISKIKMTKDQFYKWAPKGLDQRQMSDYAFNLLFEDRISGLHLNLWSEELPIELVKEYREEER